MLFDFIRIASKLIAMRSRSVCKSNGSASSVFTSPTAR